LSTLRSAARIGCVAAGLALVAATAAAGGADQDASRLIAAAARGDAAGLLALLARGADPDRADAGGWTALHQAAEAGETRIARLLLQRGASPDLRARARGTALDVAESSGRMEVARALRAAGARGSGKSIGDTVCVRPWSGDGYCAVVLGRDATRFQLRLSEVLGCESGCAAEAACSGGKVVGRAGLVVGDRLWVPASCLTHTGFR
jgi:hypothetical protein